MSRAKKDAASAFQAGQLQGLEQTQPRPVVYFRGYVKRSAVPWAEDLTLSRALLEAEYTGFWEPRSIVIFREGNAWRINPKQLLSGREDPLLEPGDTVEVQR